MILVTGGAGYIGSHFIKEYLSRYEAGQVTVIDNLAEGHRESLPDDERVHFFRADIGDVERMKDIMSGRSVEAVVHFAGSCYAGESQKNPIKYFQNNVVNSINLFRAMEEVAVRKIVFSSSCAVYGNPQYLPLDESHPLEPISVYGLTKQLVEKTLQAHVDRLGWSCITLRYFNAAGADDSGLLGESHTPETHLIPLALQAAAGKLEYLEIYGDDYDTRDGTCIRDYIHVNDLAAAHCLALEKLEALSGSEVLNLGSAQSASIKELIAICQTVTGKTINTRTLPRRDGDPTELVANSQRAKDYLGWQARYDLKRIIETAWNWEKYRRF